MKVWIGVLLLTLIAPAPAIAQTVTRVSDGDTIRVMLNGKEERIRLACIDAPEMRQAPFGKASRDRLLQLAPVGSTVRLRTLTRDRYGRIVAEVFRNAQNLNLKLVREGQAVVYRQYLQNCDRNQYLPAELEAKQRRSGFWRSGSPIMPWDFRRAQR
ncbi:thermonuclease family protein [Synechococcus elongatus]|uniref:thermonuclease family protein n=1 Tax=Synechococcus elongatus TaxID=32046 RepID=UPI000F7E2764|nr:thermonuclease family protein [Synechococcus elongatus]